MRWERISVLVLAMLFWSCRGVYGEIIDITGSAPGWSVSAGGAVDVAPQGVMGNGLSITSNDFSTGTPVSGLDLSTFDGWWAAYFPFYLPANATNVQLSYYDLTADDRGVLELNGIPIGNAGYQTGLGSMTFTDGGSNVPYLFNGQFTSGSVSAGFILGAPNLLEAIVNNTRTGITGTPQNISPMTARSSASTDRSPTP